MVKRWKVTVQRRGRLVGAPPMFLERRRTKKMIKAIKTFDSIISFGPGLSVFEFSLHTPGLSAEDVRDVYNYLCHKYGLPL